jgi:hypothetical protein
MKNIYYLYWVDSIYRIKTYHPNKKDWKVGLFIINTWINALNLWIIYIWLKFFDIIQIPLISIDLFVGDMLDKFISFTIVFALPFGIINYILVFYNDRYKTIMNKYSKPKKKIAFLYTTIIALFAFITAIVYGTLTG